MTERQSSSFSNGASSEEGGANGPPSSSSSSAAPTPSRPHPLNSPQQASPSHSSRWIDLIALDAHIASLELETTFKTVESGLRFVLIILDPVQVASYHGGATAGARLANALQKIARESSFAMEGGQGPECLAYLVSSTEHLARDRDRRDLDEFMHGFHDRAPLVFGLSLSSDSCAERKVRALIEFHGNLPSCSSIILGDRLRPIGTSFLTNSTIFDKLYYVSERDLGLSSAAAGSNNTPVVIPDIPPSSPHHDPRPGLASLRMSPSGSNPGEGIIRPPRSSTDSLPSPTTSTSRHLEPLVAIWRQSPPPCHNHYLSPSGCPHGTSCKFGHDYILSGRDFIELRASVQRMPCDSVKGGSTKPCAFGDECLYGHVCPYDEKCAWNRCKFGAIAHPRKNVARAGGLAPVSPTTGDVGGGNRQYHPGMENWSRRRRERIQE